LLSRGLDEFLHSLRRHVGEVHPETDEDLRAGPAPDVFVGTVVIFRGGRGLVMAG
jgi:hypothetical protein